MRLNLAKSALQKNKKEKNFTGSSENLFAADDEALIKQWEIKLIVDHFRETSETLGLDLKDGVLPDKPFDYTLNYLSVLSFFTLFSFL